MKGVKFLITITLTEFAEEFIDFFRKEQINTILYSLCNGTASDAMLDKFGFAKTDKVMFSCLLFEQQTQSILKDLNENMGLKNFGNGIALTIPLDSIGGESGKNYFLGDKPIVKGEQGMQDKLSKYVLIVTVANKGWTDSVMDAARKAGATGGTVVKGKGTGAEIAKFFGVSINEEKEMVYIVASRSKRDAIMQAIMQDAGVNSEAHGVTFALPVEDVVGINLDNLNE